MWIKVKDKLPSEFLIVLLWSDNGYYLGYIDDSDKWHYDCDQRAIPDNPPSHWSQLIDEPVESNDGRS